jgi:hypothetical protein
MSKATAGWVEFTTGRTLRTSVAVALKRGGAARRRGEGAARLQHAGKGNFEKVWLEADGMGGLEVRRDKAGGAMLATAALAGCKVGPDSAWHSPGPRARLKHAATMRGQASVPKSARPGNPHALRLDLIAPASAAGAEGERKYCLGFVDAAELARWSACLEVPPPRPARPGCRGACRGAEAPRPCRRTASCSRSSRPGDRASG